MALAAPLFGYSFHEVLTLAFGALLATTFVRFVVLLGYLAAGAQFSRDPLKRMKKLMDETWGGLSNVRDLNVLVIRGVDDEATLTLAAGAIGNRIIGRLYQSVAAFSTLLMALCLWHGPNGLVPRIPGLDENMNQCFATFLIIPSVALLCFILSGLFRSVYGREPSFGTFFVDEIPLCPRLPRGAYGIHTHSAGG